MGGTRQVHIPQYRAILFRRTVPQLGHLIDRSQELFPKAFPGSKWNDQKKVWRFPSGALFKLSHMQHEKDRLDHDGQEYHYVGFDELTHFSQTQYTYLHSRVRTAHPDIQCFVRASGMPIGKHITWVKQYFVDNDPYIAIPNLDDITLKPTGLYRVFIPARLEDNPALLENDPMYLQRLRQLGPRLFQALRNGDWSVIEGAVFEELDYTIHSCKPHLPPPGSTVWRALDWGYAKPFSVGWYYEDYDGVVTRFEELYGWTGKANTGCKMSARDLAKKITAMEKAMGIENKIGYAVADPSIQSKDDDYPSVYESMRDEGVYWENATNDRIQGKMEIHARLQLDESGRPRFRCTTNCKQFWRLMPVMQYSERNPEDVDTDMEDHLYDEVRYSLMSRPTLTGSSPIIAGEDMATANQDWG